MSPKNNIIVLVGLMGSGKSRIGKELARQLKLPFFDADAEIEKAAAHTIPEIFNKYGEAEFRRGEREVIQRLLSGSPKVVASGGGAFIQPLIREMIARDGISVWLRARLETLVRRTSRTDHRPLLRVADPAERLRQLMDERYPVYALADITVDADDKTPRQTASDIRSQLADIYKTDQETDD